MLKYQETYRYNDISVDLYFFCKCQKFGPHKNNNNINNNNNNFQIHKTWMYIELKQSENDSPSV